MGRESTSSLRAARCYVDWAFTWRGTFPNRDS